MKKGSNPEIIKSKVIAKKILPEKDETPINTSINNFSKKNFPIVGIGASAGGLAAFEAFFSAMPDGIDTGMAFVLVQHLAPDHKSLLTDLVKRYTSMQVFEVEDGIEVHPNCAYIIPPNHDMAFMNGFLQLLKPVAPHGLRLPIDFFFRSLANDQHERAICIVLSGTGSDGTLGVRSIKGEGGMVMVQTPESTQFDGMPRSAIATGLVDFILSPYEMPEQLIAYVKHAFGKIPAPVILSSPSKIEDTLKKIFILLRSTTGHDFSHYKRNTIIRRIERRMALHQIKEMDDYLLYFQQTNSEVNSLFRDLLIGVTSFFRDSEVFETLQKLVIPNLFSGKPAGDLIRIWIPGCSTGEEAYSIAILLYEYIEKLKQDFKIQIFATDIDPQAIEFARIGSYSASISNELSLERINRFFSQDLDGTNFRVRKVIRELIVFSEQDLIKDPPFSKLDMISCRNLLIYMDGQLQKKIIPLFHYALKQSGFLLLGTSETVGEFTELFTAMDRKSRLYQRNENEINQKHSNMGKFIPPLLMEYGNDSRKEKTAKPGKNNLQQLTERFLIQQYAPPCVVINEKGEILFIHGRTGLFLELPLGEANLNIKQMARDGLRHELTTAIHKAVTSGEPVCYQGLRVKTNGDFTTINLSVQPIDKASDRRVSSQLFMVIFEEVPSVDLPKNIKYNGSFDESNITDLKTRISLLEHELEAKEEYLKASSEELETINEELKSSNEEMQSVNEEMQSTNEELETSKEELQSVNEELTTVNTELQNKVDELSQSNNDMNNLLAVTGVGTVFVDLQLNIQKFTPAVTQIINLIQADVGRPVGHIVSNLVDYNTLVEDVQVVLDTLTPKDVEVQTKKGSWYLLRIQPYRTLDNVIEGAVITFTDVSEMKKAQFALIEFEKMRRHALVVRNANDAIIVYNTEGHILAWNPHAQRMYGWSEEEALSMNISTIVPVIHSEKALKILKKTGVSRVLKPYQTQRITKEGKILDVSLISTTLLNESGNIYAFASTEREINLIKHSKSRIKKEKNNG